MTSIKSTSSRATIMNLIKDKFGGFKIWKTIEPKLALLCSDLPEMTDDTKRRMFVNGLKKIKKCLIDEDIPEEDVTFIDDEIHRYDHTKQMSLYIEEDDLVDQDVIDNYSKMGMSTEGVMGIHLPLSYNQLKHLTNGVYQQTGLIKFYVSQEKTVTGQIVAEVYEHSQRIPIATLLESKRKDKETEEPVSKRVALFGEPYSRAEYCKIKEIEVPFFVYRFITEDDTELILMSVTKCDIGDYVVTGVLMHCDDIKMLTQSAKIPTKLPFIFAHHVTNRVLKFKNHDEFLKRLTRLRVMRENIFEYPFTMRKKGTDDYVTLIHPPWFKWLIWSWLLHKPVGIGSPYPFHIMMIAPPGTGKSKILNGLHQHSKESKNIFSGAGSTLKKLIPSFNEKPAKMGYLAESNRFAFCDEFLRCVFNTRSEDVTNIRDESFATMNDMLEHQKREVGSGVSSINVNMTARMIGMTNPIRAIDCMEDILKRIDPSFASRIIFYFQAEDHIRMIRTSKEQDLKPYTYKLSDNDWVSFIDYLHSFNATFDDDKVEKIYKSMEPLLSETLLSHYETRHDHHIRCIMDGIVKARCFFDRDMTFAAKPEDYDMLKTIWIKIIGGWADAKYIKNLPVEDRIWHLPKKSQWLYWELSKHKESILSEDAWQLVEGHMTHKEFIAHLVILRDNELVVDNDNELTVYYMSRNGDDKL